MCEYCEPLKAPKKLFNIIIDLGYFGMAKVEGTIDEYEDLRVETKNSRGKMSYVGGEHINYCPMCGRKLNGDIEDAEPL